MTHPVAAICGQNPVLPAERLGCGKPIETCTEVYRCVDCSTPFHKDCLHKHCESELLNLTLRVESAESELLRITSELESRKGEYAWIDDLLISGGVA